MVIERASPENYESNYRSSNSVTSFKDLSELGIGRTSLSLLCILVTFDVRKKCTSDEIQCSLNSQKISELVCVRRPKKSKFDWIRSLNSLSFHFLAVCALFRLVPTSPDFKVMPQFMSRFVFLFWNSNNDKKKNVYLTEIHLTWVYLTSSLFTLLSVRQIDSDHALSVGFKNIPVTWIISRGEKWINLPPDEC